MSKVIHNPALANVEETGAHSASFVIEPLQAGYGNTLGNSLRRVLLSSVKGGAIVAFTATVPDILKIARDVNAATYATFDAFGIAAVLYACLAFILIWIFRKLEQRWLAFLKPSNH
jgi:ABC-type amino acid transport system permease subunit